MCYDNVSKLTLCERLPVQPVDFEIFLKDK